MNIIDIVKNAPEGAERYKVFNLEGGVEEYYAIINGVKSFYYVREKQWKLCPASIFDSSLPLPKLKTEWVKVEDSIFELAPELKSGGLYFDWNGDESDKQAIRTESELVFLRSLHHPIYRKVEKVIDEKQEFLNEFGRVFELWSPRFGNLAEHLYGRGFRFINPE